MHLTMDKAKTAAIVLILLMSSITLLATLAQPVQAAYTNMQSGDSIPLPAGVTPDYTLPTRAYLSFRPNPIGVGQLLLVNLWINPSSTGEKRMMGYKVTITKPDGKQEVFTKDSYYGDMTAWFEYVPDQVGTYKLKFDFLGAYFPAGNYTMPSYSWTGAAQPVISNPYSLYFTPFSTPEGTLTVQQDLVASWPPSPLPTDYWTRPVRFENREWWPILGDYPWRGPGGGAMWDELYPNTNPYWSEQQRFTPWVTAPNSAHIVWKRLGAISGIIGGDAGDYATFAGGGTPNIIYQGRCYQSLTKVLNGITQRVWQCYDLRTGEIYWEKTDVTQVPTVIEYNYEQFGIDPGALLLHSSAKYIYLMYIGGGRVIKYDAFTGEVVMNMSIAPLTTGTYYKNGFCLSVQDLGAAAGANRYRLINWTTLWPLSTPGFENFTSRIVSNTSYARSSLPGDIDWNVGIGATLARDIRSGSWIGSNITGIDLYTGATLWSIDIPEIFFGTSGGGSTDVADHGKIAFMITTGHMVAYDLHTGQLAWKSPKMDYPWDEAFAAYTILSGYGKIIHLAYSGVYAFDWETGNIAWKYEVQAPSPFESPYTGANGTTVFCFRAGQQIADGKVFLVETEHTPVEPITRGWRVDAINITTGERVWNLLADGSVGPIADGYITLSAMDGYMYVVGKGKSATTVTASPKTTSLGSTIVIEGTVLDQSPAQPGTPCVSKDSMRTQMEYLHMQMPIGGLWGNETIAGIPVSLDTVDPNNNYVHIADVTTDGYSGTFGYTWTPEVPGQYTVTATFKSDDSYGSSFATTYVSVGPAPEPYPEPVEPEPAADYTPTILGATAAIIISVAIVGILLFFRKRP